MTDPKMNDAQASLNDEDIAQNPGARAAATNANPKIALEEARNAAAGESPNASGSIADSSVEDEVPSTSSPESTDLPSANTSSKKARESR